MVFTHVNILESHDVAAAFIKALNTVLPCSLSKLIEHAHVLCPEIKTFCSENELFLAKRDKGSAGKMVEFYIFGKLPNNDTSADTVFGDSKATHVKKCESGINAKERLTLTNCGSTGDYATLEHILEAATLDQNRCYPKIRTGILTVLEHGQAVSILEEKVLFLFRYDITELGPDLRSVLASDYEKIRTCVQQKTVSQKGQIYLHIHPHGSKQSKTRALGFTSKFVTTLIGYYCNLTLRQVGRSLIF